QAGVRSLLLAPLGTSGDARGALLVGWRRARAIPDGAEGVLERLADRAAIALAQAELHARERAALRQAEVERSSLEAIFDSLEDAVVTADLAGAITRLNRRAAAWAGLAGADAQGRPVAEVFPLVDAVGRPAADEDEGRAGEGVYLRRPDGDPIPVQPARSPIRDERGAALGGVLVLRDLRARRQVEQLKANILALVSHELRTPLAHIKGYASTLLQPDVEWDAETQRDFLQSIERQADRLGRLIGDLLEISRLDAGGAAQLERVAVDPAALIERGRRQAGPVIGGHPLTVAAPADLPPVWADPGHLERVLRNLLENAAKYSPPEAPIAVEAAAEGGMVAFTVRDRGSGLTAEERGHLFERFYRSPRVKHRTPGTGLGLAICREIVEAHGGAITVESSEGAGSAFRFTLPLAGREGP
ncbi:MAG TPA: ATP-binding protein, partial [Thermomicrobiales bacterium]|nr:ATP-binding protein [Thermomicrobiales bacterium]